MSIDKDSGERIQTPGIDRRIDKVFAFLRTGHVDTYYRGGDTARSIIARDDRGAWLIPLDKEIDVSLPDPSVAIGENRLLRLHAQTTVKGVVSFVLSAQRLDLFESQAVVDLYGNGVRQLPESFVDSLAP